MDVERTELPGIGVRFEMETKRKARIGIVAHREGRRDFIVYDRDDPDFASECIVLNSEESAAIGQMLGGAQIVEKLNKLHREIDNLESRPVIVDATSPFVGKALGATKARSRTGASIVAIVNEDNVSASPKPDVILQAGDKLIVIGTNDAVDAVAQIVRGDG